MQGDRVQGFSLTPTYKVHNLQPVAIFQRRFRPLRARHNFAIEFDGDAVALHAKLLDQLSKGKSIVKNLILAINRQAHNDSFKFRVSRCKSSFEKAVSSFKFRVGRLV